MEKVKVDRTKLITVTNYADKIKKKRQTVYNWIKEGKLKTIEIDGVKFIDIS